MTDNTLKINSKNLQRSRLVCQKVSIIGGLKVKLQIVKRVALDQVEVVCLLHDAVLEAAAEALQVAIVDVEYVPLHDAGQ